MSHRDHKYIKREWKNGRWQYYYKDTKGTRTDLKVLSKVADYAGADEKTRLQRSAAITGMREKTYGAMENQFSSEKTKYKSAIYDHNKAKKDFDESVNEYNHAVQNMVDSASGKKKTYPSSKYGIGTLEMFARKSKENLDKAETSKNNRKNAYSSTRSQYNIARKSYTKSKKETAAAKEAYDKTFLGKVDKGKSWVAKLFKNKGNK